MRLVLLGAPGSGKGTQAQKLVSKFSVPQVSTGDLLRESVEAETTYGVLARDAMDAGNLVSDEIVLGIIRERLSEKDAAKGFILDGFPRNISQAQALDELLDELEVPLDGAVLMEVDYEALMQRLTGRRTCTSCGAVFNVFTSPAALDDRCDSCGGRLRHRADDNEDTINNRLRVYENHTRPVIAYYEFNGLLNRLDGVGNPDDVFRRLVDIVRPLRNRRRRRMAARASLTRKSEPVVEPEVKSGRKPKAAKPAVKKAAKKVAKKKVAKKKVGKKKVGKKKVSKKRAAKKKVSKKRAAKKKVAKKKATKRRMLKKKKTKKKVSRKKTSRKTTRKKTSKRKTSKKKASRKKASKKKTTRKKMKKRPAKKRAKKKSSKKRKATSRKTTRKKTKKRATKKKAKKKKAKKRRSRR